MEVAVNATYGSLQFNGQCRGGYWQVAELRSDNTWTFEKCGNLPIAEIDQFEISSTNSVINDI